MTSRWFCHTEHNGCMDHFIVKHPVYENWYRFFLSGKGDEKLFVGEIFKSAVWKNQWDCFAHPPEPYRWVRMTQGFATRKAAAFYLLEATGIQMRLDDDMFVNENNPYERKVPRKSDI